MIFLKISSKNLQLITKLICRLKRLKDSIKTMIKTELFDRGILKSQLPTEAAISDRFSMSRLTFEQQKQLLLIETRKKNR